MSDWWKFDKDDIADPIIVAPVRECQVCGRLIDEDRQARPLSFCDGHLAERDRVIAEVQAHERQAFEALVEIQALAEKHPAYAPHTVANALAHLSGTVQHVEGILSQQTKARAALRDDLRGAKHRNDIFDF